MKNDLKEAVSGNSSAEAKAVTRYVRVSPRKVRLVLETIRRKPIDQAFSILANMKKKSAHLVAKTLKSAVANAKVKKMEENRLFVRLAFADGGPTLKRYLPRAMGRADTIIKRTSHLTIVVNEGALRTNASGKDGTEKSSGMENVSKKQKSMGKKNKELAAAS